MAINNIFAYYCFSIINNDIAIDENATYFGDKLTEEVLTSAKTDAFVPPAPGVYFCSIKNIYNGTEAVTNSPFYTVVE